MAPPILFLLGLHSNGTRFGPWICRPVPSKRGVYALRAQTLKLDEYKKVGADATCWMSDGALPYHITNFSYLAVCKVAETCQFAIPAKHICQASLAKWRRSATTRPIIGALSIQLKMKGFTRSRLSTRLCRMKSTCWTFWSHGCHLPE
jgi:hypothetical protein